MSMSTDDSDREPPLSADPDAHFVAAALPHLRLLDDSERARRSHADWVRDVIGALRRAGAIVVPPSMADADVWIATLQTAEGRAALDRGFRATPQEMGRAALEAAQREDASRRRALLALIGPEIASRDPATHRGDLMFAGTRVPVAVLFGYLRQGDTVDAFLADYPTVGRERVERLLDLVIGALGGV